MVYSAVHCLEKQKQFFTSWAYHRTLGGHGPQSWLRWPNGTEEEEGKGWSEKCYEPPVVDEVSACVRLLLLLIRRLGDGLPGLRRLSRPLAADRGKRRARGSHRGHGGLAPDLC